MADLTQETNRNNFIRRMMDASRKLALDEYRRQLRIIFGDSVPCAIDEELYKQAREKLQRSQVTQSALVLSCYLHVYRCVRAAFPHDMSKAFEVIAQASQEKHMEQPENIIKQANGLTLG